tara:strand:- start:1380 stop:2450 length:1071 start_codon:yes stop_codon:yes gene_type:complete
MSGRIILLLALCCSSSSAAAAAAAFTKGGDLLKPLGPPAVVDVPPEFRTSSQPWGSNRGQRKNHNRGKLDSPQAWSSIENSYGKWYQMDNGKIADISGVAIKGRMNYDQWVKTFKVKYYHEGSWRDVDKGAVFDGNKDRDTLVEVKFATPVKTRYIRIYPKTWHGHMSLRAGLITNSTLKKSELKLLNIPGNKRAASSWWKNNDNSNWHPNKGTLGSRTGWHPKHHANKGNEWHEMQMDSPTKVGGVAIQGRGDGGTQWVTAFTVKYKDSTGQWKNVDNGSKFFGTSNEDDIVWVPFNTPVSTTAVRIYPKEWNSWFSGRFDLLGLTGSSSEGYEIGGSEGYEIGGYEEEVYGISS